MGWIDRAMQKRGYKLMSESQFGVRYERRENIPHGAPYYHLIYLGRKSNGNHILQSYDSNLIKTENGDYFNSVCGIEIPVLLLMWFKAKYMIRKYHWKRYIEERDESEYIKKSHHRLEK